MPGADARRRVLAQRCKPCSNTDNRGDMPKYLQAGLTQYVPNNLSKIYPPYNIYPPYRVTQENFSSSLERLGSGVYYRTPIASGSTWSYCGG